MINNDVYDNLWHDDYDVVDNDDDSDCNDGNEQFQ